MQRSVEVTTGEGVAFSYELAGIGSRFIAVLVDSAIQIVVAALAMTFLIWTILEFLPTSVHQLSGLTSKFTEATLITIVTALGFLLFSGYFIIFEWRWSGRTPGKRLLGLRVVRDGGFPLDFTASAIRNTVRILESGLGFYAISALCVLCSPNRRRLGDYAAGTIVVRDHRYERTALPSYREEPGDVLIAALGEPERELIRNFAARRASLTRAARASLATSIAATVRPQLPASFAPLSDEELLAHLATTAL